VGFRVYSLGLVKDSQRIPKNTPEMIVPPIFSIEGTSYRFFLLFLFTGFYRLVAFNRFDSHALPP
jgi:hypothetical protein